MAPHELPHKFREELLLDCVADLLGETLSVGYIVQRDEAGSKREASPCG